MVDIRNSGHRIGDYSELLATKRSIDVFAGCADRVPALRAMEETRTVSTLTATSKGHQTFAPSVSTTIILYPEEAYLPARGPG